MAIETLEDIVESIADKWGIYGACEHEYHNCDCRKCWVSRLKSRILAAVEVEQAIQRGMALVTNPSEMSAAALDSGALGELRPAEADRLKDGGI